MTIIVFIFYLLLFCVLVTKTGFLKNSGLNSKWLVSLFLIKITAGLLYAWFYSHISGADTWEYFAKSKTETDWLLRDPIGFIKDLFSYSYQKAGGLFSGENSYWNDLKSNVLIKLMAVFNVLSGKNYFANLVFFNFLFMFGPVAFFRMMHDLYPQKKSLLIISVFFLPSFLFWCSGAHKDGLIFSATALTMYFFYIQLKQKKIILKYCFIILICGIALFALRNFIFFLLIPALFAWFLSNRYPSKKAGIFICIYAAGIILFFSLPVIHPLLNFPQYITSKQNEFKALGGNSQITLRHLDPSFFSFIQFFPSALDIIFFRPHISDVKNFGYVPALLENVLILIIIFFSFIYRDKKQNLFSPPLLFCLFFSISVLLVSGYTITLSAAISRYKSIVLPSLITVFFIHLDANKLPFLNRFKKSN